MVIAFDKKSNKVFVTLTDDCGENKGGYFCQVYTDEDFQNEIDNFCLHHEDCKNLDEYQIDEMIEQVIALSNYSNFFQKKFCNIKPQQINNNMVKWYWKCNCCASIVIHFDNGTKKSVTEKYIKDKNIDLTNAVKLLNSYVCENCFPMEKVKQ